MFDSRIHSWPNRQLFFSARICAALLLLRPSHLRNSTGTLKERWRRNRVRSYRRAGRHSQRGDGQERTLQTNNEGRYVAAFLPGPLYRDGFKHRLQQDRAGKRRNHFEPDASDRFHVESEFR